MVAVVLLIAGVLLMRNRLVTNPQQKGVLAGLSQLNFSGMEPQVVSKIQKLRQDVHDNPESADAWGKLAMNLDAAGLEKETIPVYEEAATLNPNDFRWPYFSAITLSEQGSDETLSMFERAYKIKPDYVPLILKYANTLFQYGKIDQASQKYDEAIKYDPNSAHAFFGLAQISFSKGDMQTARAMSQKAFEKDPSFGEAYNLLASVCRRMSDANCVEEATAAAKVLPTKSELSDPIYAQIGAEGESSIWHRARGSEYLKQKNYDAAIREFQEAIRIRSDVQTHEDLAQALSAGGKFSEAVDQYQQIVQQHPTARNYFGLALAYAKMGSYDQAQHFFQKAIEENPDFAEAYFNLAVAYAKTGRLPETIESLQQAVRINPDYTEAHYHLALAYLQANNRKLALEEGKIVMKLNPNAGKQLETLMEESKAE